MDIYDFSQFLSDLVSGIIGGFVISGAFTFIENRKVNRKLEAVNDLIEIRGEAIQHRNSGEKLQKSGDASDISKETWVSTAVEIQKRAIDKAKKLNPASGAIVEWLDRIEPYRQGVEVQKWVSMLSKVIERITTILEQNI